MVIDFFFHCTEISNLEIITKGEIIEFLDIADKHIRVESYKDLLTFEIIGECYGAGFVCSAGFSCYEYREFRYRYGIAYLRPVFFANFSLRLIFSETSTIF